MKNWNAVLIDASPLFNFLNQSVFFDKPYIGNPQKNKIIFDIALAEEYSTDDSGDNFEDWQSLLESITPAWPDMPRKIENEIIKTLDEMTKKDFTNLPSETLINNMQGDISRLLHCYAFGDVHHLWKEVEQAYLEGGLPCGWDGNFPQGKLVVFSPQPS